MDFQAIADRMTAMTCVISVEALPEGRYGKLRLVAGNKAYIDSIEHPAPGITMLKNKFVPNSEYTDYLSRDLNFENYCYGAAVEKKILHSYVHPERMPGWFNMLFIPLSGTEDNLNYCLYIMEINTEADSKTMSDISGDIASSVLDTCIRLRGTTDFKATMQDVVAGIRELCEAEYCCAMVINDYDRSCSVLGEAFSDDTGLFSMEKYLDDDFYDLVESWGATIAGSNCLIAKNDSDMEVVKERNPGWYESLTGAGARNIVLFPLKSRNQLLGYMWALNFNPHRAEKIKETLEVTTFIVGSEMGNYFLLDRLRMLSSKDLLTGVMNRNEMNNYVDSLCNGGEEEKTSVGVIFADLNGLKAVNDLKGHNAGDILLKNAAMVLREVFDESSIFRAGGDEFSIIVTEITKEELDSKINDIRRASERFGNVVFALGGAVEDDSRNVRLALRHADEAMYADKKLFYEKNPDKVNENRMSRATEDKVDEKFREISFVREMNHDELTGLPGMTAFLELAEKGRREMHEKGATSALVYFNLSGMKYYNKRYGFAEGNVLLREFGGHLTRIFGKERSSRLAQDNFAAFAENDGLEDKLRELFASSKKINNRRSLPVKAGIYLDSMGMVEAPIAFDRAKTAGESINKDDKESHFCYFDNKMLEKELNRQYIIDNLDRAISENWVKAFYQPIIRAAGRKVCDEEALARWIDPVKGMMSPGDFIPVLEDTKLIYKVDLHIVDIIIERLKKQEAAGYKTVPISVNLSRTDFESCDIVEEINNRVEAAGISRNLLTIEITESVVGENFEFMKEQIDRFRELGFKIWMDDFGSGYSSLDLLQEMQFDLIKFDMRFMRQFDNNKRSRIVLSELMRMAQSLGIETVCEGVETAEQADFLTETGCTRLQGYYFSKPVPLEEEMKRYSGKEDDLGIENTDEAKYYKALGSVNMFDLSSVSADDTESSKDYYDSLPMGIIEYNGREIKVIRSNKSYMEFLGRFFSEKREEMTDSVKEAKGDPEADFIRAIKECMRDGNRVFLDERMEDGTTVHVMLKMIAENPAIGISAFVVAVLDITKERDAELTYANVAQALSSDYEYLYYVNKDNGRFVEYSHEGGSRGLSAERHGNDFFNEARKDALKFIYEDDRSHFLEFFKKDNILKTINEQGVFVLNYRLLKEGKPTYVSMKIVPMNNDHVHIIIGVNNVDVQMRQQETIERLKEEQTTYSRISALMGNYIAIYTVDPQSGNYMQYSASEKYSKLGIPKVRTDFYNDSIEECRRVIHPDDLDYFMSVFSKEKILKGTRDGKVYKIRYRLLMDNEPIRISLRACIVEEQDGPQLIVGVNRSSEEIV